MESWLSRVKPMLDSSSIIQFNAHIRQNDPGNFGSHTSFIDYIKNKFIPLINPSDFLRFRLYFGSMRNQIPQTIAELLEVFKTWKPNLEKLEIEIINSSKIVLPEEEVFNWLANTDTVLHKERFIEIIVANNHIGNGLEILSYFEKVCLYEI